MDTKNVTVFKPVNGVVGLWCLVPLSTIISVMSWRSVLLVEGTWENHRPVASNWQTLSHNVESSTLMHELATLLVLDTDCTCCCKSNYHTIMITTMTPLPVNGIPPLINGCSMRCRYKQYKNTDSLLPRYTKCTSD
jgi:hypothetical protein